MFLRSGTRMLASELKSVDYNGLVPNQTEPRPLRRLTGGCAHAIGIGLLCLHVDDCRVGAPRLALPESAAIRARARARDGIAPRAAPGSPPLRQCAQTARTGRRCLGLDLGRQPRS